MCKAIGDIRLIRKLDLGLLFIIVINRFEVIFILGSLGHIRHYVQSKAPKEKEHERFMDPHFSCLHWLHSQIKAFLASENPKS